MQNISEESCVFLYQTGIIDPENFPTEWNTTKKFFYKNGFNKNLKKMLLIEDENSNQLSINFNIRNKKVCSLKIKTFHFTGKITFDNLNFYRLFYIRLQRLLLSFSFIANKSHEYIKIVCPIVLYTAPH